MNLGSYGLEALYEGTIPEHIIDRAITVLAMKSSGMNEKGLRATDSRGGDNVQDCLRLRRHFHMLIRTEGLVKSRVRMGCLSFPSMVTARGSREFLEK